MKTVTLLCSILLSLSTFADLKTELSAQVTADHTYRIHSYKTARKFLFGKLHLENNNTVKDVYCERVYDGSDGVGPMRIPNSRILNCEHTHPQSKFNPNENNKDQKGDLHHLYPTESKSNSTRSNHPFGNVKELQRVVCGISYKGKNKYNEIVFEPPQNHKGNVARAKFYFSIRYKVAIDDRQEATLRLWHEEDPVDDEEIKRNKMIRDIQGNLNPFIEYPSLVTRIRNF